MTLKAIISNSIHKQVAKWAIVNVDDIGYEIHASYLMDSNQSGYELHQHDLHLEALFRLFQLLQQFLWEILIWRDV